MADAKLTEAPVKRVSFAAGEVSEELIYRDDLARTQIGVRRAENFAVLLEGGLTRCSGTRFVLPLKTESEVGRLITFRYSGADNYRLVFNGGKMRVVKAGGFLESSPGVVYETDQPYAAADMENLRAWQSPGDNRVFFVCAGYEPRVLTRAGHTSWSFAEYRPANGPVEAQNLDTAKTISATGTSGNIHLSANFAAFVSGDVNSVWRFDESNLGLTPEWKANETITLPIVAANTGTPIGDMTGSGGLAAAFDGNLGTDAVKLSAAIAYVGLSGAASVHHVTVTGDSTAGQGFVSSANPFVLVKLWAKTGAAPSTPTDGTLLGSALVGDISGASVLVTSGDVNTVWDHRWVSLEVASVAASLNVAEVDFQKVDPTAGTVLRRWNGNVYQALAAGNSGEVAPTHDEGDAGSDILWRYRHGPMGFARITAVISSAEADATVLLRLPDSVNQQPGYRWYPGAWGAARGWPEQIQGHDGRIVFFRRDAMWVTRPSDLFSLEVIPGDEDSAIAARLKPSRGKLPYIEWMSSASVLVLGGRDAEWVVRPPGVFDVLTAENMSRKPDTSEGSAPHEPADVDDGVLFIGRSRQRLHFITFAKLPAGLDVEEVTISSRHILTGRAKRVAFERDPNRIAWVGCQDGTLMGLTFMPRQQVNGWFRRPLVNGIVEDISSAPADDEGRSETYLIVRRTVDGATRRYVELMQPFFAPASLTAPTAAGAWFADCALRYQGAPATVISGLSHLKGQTVAVFADGAEHPRLVVSGSGTVTLTRAASDVIVGLPMRGYVKLLPLDADNTPGGPTKGKDKSAHHVIVDMVQSAGGAVAVNGQAATALQPTGTLGYAAAVPLRTQSMLVSTESVSALTLDIEITCDNALPFTLAGVTPQMEAG